jgi:urea transport system ATP-binding protein
VTARALLVVDDVTVRFDGFRALDRLTLTIDEGELRVILGPNGAGKTTLMDVITGKTRPDTGRVLFGRDRRDLGRMPEHAIVRAGIGRKFQRPTVFAAHTVTENLELAAAGQRGVLRALFARNRARSRRTTDVLEQVHLADKARAPAGSLSHGEKQWLEIGMLLMQDPKLLLVDEPVAGMTHEETARTARLLEGLAGVHTVVVVEHDMEFVRSIARRVTVLHEGRVLADGDMRAIKDDPRVVEVYLGA